MMIGYFIFIGILYLVRDGRQLTGLKAKHLLEMLIGRFNEIINIEF